jgi:hypothetical protein
MRTPLYPASTLKNSCVLLEFSCLLSRFLVSTFGKLVRTSRRYVRGLALLTRGPKKLITSPKKLTRGLENLFIKFWKLIMKIGTLLNIKIARNPLLSRLWAIICKLLLSCCKRYRLAGSAPAMYVFLRLLWCKISHLLSNL